MRKFIFLLYASICTAQCTISPTTPQAVVGGGTFSFSQSDCTGAVWSIVSGVGTVNSSGLYTAPSTVHIQDVGRGVEEFPRTSPYVLPVNTLPVHPSSATWLGRIAGDPGMGMYQVYGNPKVHPDLSVFWENVVTNGTSNQLMHFYYPVNSNGYQDTNFPLPPPPYNYMESGRFFPQGAGFDQHFFTSNAANLNHTEIYNLYTDYRTSTFTSGNPTQIAWTTNSIYQPPNKTTVYVDGCTAGTNINGAYLLTPTTTNHATIPVNSSVLGVAGCKAYGLGFGSLSSFECQNCNSQGGQKFNPGSYAQLGGVDAAGMPMGGISFKPQELWNALQQGLPDLGHAIRTTFSNQYFSSRNVWPATLFALSNAGFPNNIVTCTNANPTHCQTLSDLSLGAPCTGYTYFVGCTFPVSNYGMTGSWTPLNGNFTATAIDTHHVSIPLNTTSFGAFTGSSPFLENDFMPYGACMRLKASFNNSSVCTTESWCSAANIILNTWKKYCIFAADGTANSDNWDMGLVSSEFHPEILEVATFGIEGKFGFGTPNGPFGNSLEVVDLSSQQVSSNLNYWQQTGNNRTIVQVCNSGLSNCAADDVINLGTAIGTSDERIIIGAGTSYILNIWVTGNTNTGRTCTIDSGILGSFINLGTCEVTMPACTTRETGYVTSVAQADPTAKLYIQVDCLPVGTDGGYRLAIGNYDGGFYTDVSGNKWWASYIIQPFNNSVEFPGVSNGTQNGTWPGFSPCSGDTWSGTDSELYNRSNNLSNDIHVKLIIPNGTYAVNMYGEPGFNGIQPHNLCGNMAGNDIFTWVLQGSIQAGDDYVDGYQLAGNQAYHGFNLNGTAVVSDNTLNSVFYIRIPSTYGISMSSMSAIPSFAPGTSLINKHNSVTNGNVVWK